MLFLHGEPVRKRIGDRIHNCLRLVLTASAENIGSDAETSLDNAFLFVHSYFTPFVRFPTPSHTIDDIGWLVLPVTRCIIAKNGQNARDTYMLCVTLCNVLSEIVKSSSADLFSNAIFVTQPDISTAVWIKLHRLSIFMGRIGVMETIFPHCQQSFQHKCSAINEVMLTLSRFPPPAPAFTAALQVGHMCPLLPHIFCPAAAGCARKKPREHTAPGADGDAVCVPAHWPMSWQ